MEDFATAVAYYLERFEQGDENAYFRLIDLPVQALPHIVSQYESSTDGVTKEFLLSVLWQSRDPTVIPVLARALFEGDARLWREALDGLVTLASDESLAALRSARDRPFEHSREMEDFRSRLDEAIFQAEQARTSNVDQ